MQVLPFDNFVAADSFRIYYQVSYLQCLKSVRIRSYSGPQKYGNTDQNNSEYEHFLRITYYYLHSSQMLTFFQSSKKLDQSKKNCFSLAGRMLLFCALILISAYRSVENLWKEETRSGGSFWSMFVFSKE